MNVFLETERLCLREFTPTDVEALFQLDSDPEVMRYLTGGAATPYAMVRDVILPGFLACYGKYDGLGYWAAEDRTSGAFVGWFGLHPGTPPRPGELELGYRIRREQWGQGLATEGSRALIAEGFTSGAARITAQTYEDNLASRRVMEKVGMSHVRSFRIESQDDLATSTFDPGLAPLFDGDDVEYAMDRSAWLAAPSRPTR